MKKICFVLLAIFFLSTPALHAQLVVAAPILETLFTQTGIEQAIHNTQMLAQTIQGAINTYNQLQTALRMYQMALNNIGRIADVRNWDDFMAWYNRQLQLERRTEQQIERMNVRIGNNTHGIRDIMSIPDSIREQHVDSWGEELTDRQRREMWLNLGLTPANHAYISVWRERNRNIEERFLARAAVENEVGMEITTQLAGYLQSVENARAQDEWSGEQELLSILIEMQGIQIEQLLAMNMTLAEFQEWMAIQNLQERTVHDAPALSPHWNDSPFRPLTMHGIDRR